MIYLYLYLFINLNSIKYKSIYIYLIYNMNKMNKMIVSIEGNIGSGKSTLVNFLKEKYSDKILFIDEPVDEWKKMKMDNKDVLEHFYLDQKKYSYLFQSFAYITRLKYLQDALNNPDYDIIITERSTESDKYLFAKMLYEQKIMNELEWKVYNTWYDYFNINIDLFIYVKTDIDNCIKRIKMRDRSGEDSISKKYLTDLHNKHEEWLSIKKNILVINGNNNIYDEKIKNNYCKTLYNYLSQSSS